MVSAEYAAWPGRDEIEKLAALRLEQWCAKADPSFMALVATELQQLDALLWAPHHAIWLEEQSRVGAVMLAQLVAFRRNPTPFETDTLWGAAFGLAVAGVMFAIFW